MKNWSGRFASILQEVILEKNVPKNIIIERLWTISMLFSPHFVRSKFSFPVQLEK